MPFDAFMRLALYDPQVGYYRSARRRVGYGGATDFFTASTSGAIFGELVAAAARHLLRGNDPRGYAFVEIGAEPGGDGVLTGVSHPFGSTRTVRVGEPLEFNGPCVVFSNELFDAQPFRRFVFRAGGWRELGVTLAAGTLQTSEMARSGAGAVPVELPPTAPDGYVIDAPLAAVALIGQIATQAWTGLFLACDYGKSWPELAEACPSGTARAYHRHTQSNELLAQPGEQDLTCHVCWDWLAAALSRHRFDGVQLESQEAFWIRHAADYIARASVADAGRFSQRKLSLLQLLHPAHLGQKFQVLHAWRSP